MSTQEMNTQPSVRFSVIGADHFHIYAQIDQLLEAGAELVAAYTQEAEQLEAFMDKYPQAQSAKSQQEILEDESIQLIVTAGIPCERAPLGILAMQHGKDFMTDKPGFTTMEQLAEVRRIAAETGRIYSVDYSGRFESRATTKASQLVHSGAIGRVLQTTSLGPHRLNLPSRAAWFFEREKYGGILCDVATHHADYFLHFTGASDVEIVSAQVANWHHPQYPELEDFGEVMLRSTDASGYFRVDWFTPDGLPTWGDTRLTILGTEGTIEVRSTCDPAGRPGGDHLILVDQQETRYMDCSQVELPYARQLLADVQNRTETAMTQEYCFQASELVLKAQEKAVRMGNLQ